MDALLIAKKLKEFFDSRVLENLQAEKEIEELSETLEDFFAKDIPLHSCSGDIKNPLAIPEGLLPFPRPLPGRVLGVDGGESQFSHHEGLSLEVVSLAAVYIDYINSSIKTFVDLQPFEKELDFPLTLKRFFLELETAISKANEWRPDILLLDGSLIPWPLLRLNNEERKKELLRWKELLGKLPAKTKIFGFISDSNASELANTLQRLLSNKSATKVLDKHLLKRFLTKQPQYRESLFIFKLDFGECLLSEISAAYFLFGNEVCRLEWFGRERDFSIILDLLNKGKGYPSVLKEAHKLASLSQKDREVILGFANSFRRKIANLSLKGLQKRL